MDRKVSTAEIIVAYHKLGTAEKVAKLFGTTHSNIIQRMQNANAPRHRPGRRPKRP